MKSLPKYIEKALKDRTKYIKKAMDAGYIIDKYAENILHIKGGSETFNEACLASDFRIFCEVDCTEDTTRQVLLRELNKKKTEEE